MKFSRLSVLMAGIFSLSIVSAQDLKSSDIWIQPSKAGYQVEFVRAGSDVAGLQFDLHDPNISKADFTCGTATSENHFVNCNLHADAGFLRVIVYTVTGELLPDSTIVEVANAKRANALPAVSASVSGAPTLKGVLLSNAKGQDVTSEHLR